LSLLGCCCCCCCWWWFWVVWLVGCTPYPHLISLPPLVPQTYTRPPAHPPTHPHTYTYIQYIYIYINPHTSTHIHTPPHTYVGTRPRGVRGRSGRCTWTGRWRARMWRPSPRLRRSWRWVCWVGLCVCVGVCIGVCVEKVGGGICMLKKGCVCI
jgi:hypothetical protein